MALIPPNLMVVKPSILVRCNLLSCRGVLRISAVRFFRFFFLSIFFFCAGNLYPLGPLHAAPTGALYFVGARLSCVLGGALISLIEDVETHFLVQDVLVDARTR